jgi:hypothetical protein
VVGVEGSQREAARLRRPVSVPAPAGAAALAARLSRSALPAPAQSLAPASLPRSALPALSALALGLAPAQDLAHAFTAAVGPLAADVPTRAAAAAPAPAHNIRPPQPLQLAPPPLRQCGRPRRAFRHSLAGRPTARRLLPPLLLLLLA